MKRYARGSHPYYQYKRKRSLSLNVKKQRWPWLLVALPSVLLFLIGSFLYSRPLPLLHPEKKALALTTKQPVLEWPTGSQAAFGTVEQGLLESEKNQTPRPTASVAKLLTVLTILRAKPLKVGEQGPLIPITQADVDIYNDYYSKDGSSVPVAIGEQVSEYQMLQGVLLPSANNYADTLAIWAFGSLDKYRQAAQKMAQELGLKQTTVGTDASGFSPTTVSTASDLALLGIAAIKHPLIAQIVQIPEAELPIVGVKKNTNWLLGDEGVVGLKTGNTNEAGGVFVFAYNYQLDLVHKTTIVGAIQGEPTGFEAILKARPFINEIKSHFKVATPIKKGQVVATYMTPWGQQTSAVAKNNISLAMWPGATLKPQMTLTTISADSSAGSEVGTIKVSGVSSSVITNKSLSGPSWQWRLFGR
jgi:D-alanyl-D-alanine carboxypeptidase (penicillin-binding protein 5/6)